MRLALISLLIFQFYFTSLQSQNLYPWTNIELVNANETTTMYYLFTYGNQNLSNIRLHQSSHSGNVSKILVSTNPQGSNPLNPSNPSELSIIHNAVISAYNKLYYWQDGFQSSSNDEWIAFDDLETWEYYDAQNNPIHLRLPTAFVEEEDLHDWFYSQIWSNLDPFDIGMRNLNERKKIYKEVFLAMASPVYGNNEQFTKLENSLEIEFGTSINNTIDATYGLINGWGNLKVVLQNFMNAYEIDLAAKGASAVQLGRINSFKQKIPGLPSNSVSVIGWTLDRYKVAMKSFLIYLYAGGKGLERITLLKDVIENDLEPANFYYDPVIIEAVNEAYIEYNDRIDNWWDDVLSDLVTDPTLWVDFVITVVENIGEEILTHSGISDYIVALPLAALNFAVSQYRYLDGQKDLLKHMTISATMLSMLRDFVETYGTVNQNKLKEQLLLFDIIRNCSYYFYLNYGDRVDGNWFTDLLYDLNQWLAGNSWGNLDAFKSYLINQGEISLNSYRNNHAYYWDIYPELSWITSLYKNNLSANFTSNTTSVNTGQPVSFTDNSSGNPTTWQWIFEGGIPSISNEQNPVVIYSASGTFDVTLTIGNGTFSNTSLINDYITVNSTTPTGPWLSLTNTGNIPNPVSYSGGTYTINVNNTGIGTLSWNTQNIQSWVHVSPTSGNTNVSENVIITIDPNGTSSSRNCDICFYNTVTLSNYQYLPVFQSATPAPTANWDSYYKDGANQGFQNIALNTSVGTQWSTTSPVPLDADNGVVVGENRIIMSSSSGIICYDLLGNIVWSRIPFKSVSFPAIYNNVLFIADDQNGGEGKLWAINLNTGGTIDETPGSNPFKGKIKADASGIYIPCEMDRIYAYSFNGTSFSLKWYFDSYATSQVGKHLNYKNSGVAIYGSYIYFNGVTSDKHQLWGIRVNISDGTFSEHFLIEDPSNGIDYCNPPVVFDSKVYFSFGVGTTAALQCKNIALGAVWSYDSFPDDLITPPVCYNSKLYVGDGNGNVFCLNSSTGALVFSNDYGTGIENGMAVTNNCLVVVRNDYFNLLNLSSGAKITEFSLMSSSYTAPAVSGNKIITANTAEKIYCISDVFPPVANFSGTPTSGYPPLTVAFTDNSASGSSPITSRFWNFGDGSTSSQTNPNHVYSTSGNYSVSLTVTSNVGSSTKTRNNYVSVWSQPQVIFIPATHNFGGSYAGICSNEYAYILKNNGGGIATGSVSLTNGTDFTIADGGGSFSLPSGQSKNIMVKFCPASTGNKTTTLFADGTAPTNDVSASLTGTGITSITVHIPNGNESWSPGTTHDIVWNDVITETIEIDLYKGDELFLHLASGVPGNESHSWVIPSDLPFGNDYKIKVSSSAHPSVYDISNNNFNILCPEWPKTWIGTTNDDWNTSSNWNPAGVPNPNDNIIIPSEVNNLPKVQDDGLSCNDITVKNNAGLTVNTGNELTVNGTLTLEGYPCPGMPTLTDARDGKVYNTVRIGSKCWMKENLNVGTRINASSNQTNNSVIEKYCYSNSETNCDVYGGLYQWGEMVQYLNGASNSSSWDPAPTGNVSGICPSGWHLPSDAEWTTLITYIGGETTAGKAMKETGTAHWYPYNWTTTTNSSGFTALPGGICSGGYGSFYSQRYLAYFGSSTESDSYSTWMRILTHYGESVERRNDSKTYGTSVRCVYDQDPTSSGFINCTYPVINGQYDLGTQLTNSNSVTLDVNVTTPGTFIITTDDVNGMSFSAMGSFPCEGVQSVTLTGSGSPQSPGLSLFAVTYGSSNCEFIINIPEPLILPCPGSPVVTDPRDGRSYNTVQIGSQCWMKENLNVGTRIDGVNEPLNNNIIEKYCSNDYDFNCDYFGGLYTWDEMMQYTTQAGSKGICMDGWHVPTGSQYSSLISFVGENGNYPYPGGRLKSTGTLDQGNGLWMSPNSYATNSSGFSAFPGGIRLDYGFFDFTWNGGFFWSSSESGSSDAFLMSLWNWHGGVDWGADLKSKGASVRCIKDVNNPSSGTINCTSTAVNGIYRSSLRLTSSNTITLNVNVTTTGDYTIFTSNVNGYMFIASGTFTTTGTRTVTLNGTGRPVNSGANLFTVTYGGSTCTFSVNVSSLVQNDPCPGVPTITDPRNGKTYHTVQIGTQCWLRENLNIGAPIPGAQSQANNGIIEKYCYNDIESNCDTYGGLYQWSEIMQGSTIIGAQGICPSGWYIPSDDDWTQLAAYLGGSDIAGGSLKEIGYSHWLTPNNYATNTSGFTALPSGQCGPSGFSYLNSVADFWSSTMFSPDHSFVRSLSALDANVYRSSNGDPNNFGNSVRCIKNTNSSSTVPAVTTSTVTDATQTSAISGGNVTNDGGNNVTVRGVCWSTSPNPTLANSYTISGTGSGSFVSNLTGLLPSTLYYLRAYATNAMGTAFGNEVVFSTQYPPCPGIPTVTYEGKTYNTALIGTQCWLKENLNAGLLINSSENQNGTNGIIEKYCYNNNESNCDVYGALYQWNEIMQGSTNSGTQGICPPGWYIPTDDDWTQLAAYLGGSDIAGGPMKEAGYTHWITPNTGATNLSGFTALPAGKLETSGFTSQSEMAYFWSSMYYSSDHSYMRSLSTTNAQIYRSSNGDPNNYGYSVRCLKD